MGWERSVRESTVSPRLGVAPAFPWVGSHLDPCAVPTPGVLLLTGKMSSVPWSARSLCSGIRVSPVQVPLWAAQ